MNNTIYVKLLWALCLLASCGGTKEKQAEETIDPFEGLVDGWNQIKPGGNTTCSDGSEYAFYFRPGSSEQLVVFFQGGGACWNNNNCDLDHPTYDATVAEEDDPRAGGEDALGRGWDGIFNGENPDNPVADYSFLFIPYCTGDVHLGQRNVMYSDTVSVRHQGFENAESALNWAFERLSRVSQVFVTGESAGSLASTIYAVAMAKRYPDAQIVQLGDASAAYESDNVPATMATWATHEVVSKIYDQALDSTTMDFEQLAIMAAKKYPDARFSVYNSANDEVQYFFLQQLGESEFEVSEKLSRNLDKIHREVDNFYHYTDSGAHHTILSREVFYTSEIDGVKLSSWVKNLLEGEPVNNLNYQ